MMYRILIVDDESNHRKGLMSLIQEICPECVLLEADDGTAAMSVMEMIPCDIIITDIRMVNMDGLKLLRLAKEKKPDVEVIILSGYGQFAYAKEAMRYQAADYIMKPVDREEITAVLHRSFGKIEQKKQEKEKSRELQSQLTETMPVYVEHLMNLLVDQKEFLHKEKILELFPLRTPGWFFICHVKNREDGDMQDLWRQDLKYCMKKCLDPESSYSFFYEKEPSLLVACVLGRQGYGRGKWEAVRMRILEETGMECRLYIGCPVSDLFRDAVESFAECYNGWKYHFYELDTILIYEKIKEKVERPSQSIHYDIEPVTEELKKGNMKEAWQIFEKKLGESLEKTLPLPAVLKQKVIFSLFQMVRYFEVLLSEGFKREINLKIQEIQNTDSLSELKRRTYQFIVNLGREVEEQKNGSSEDLLLHCREFLDTHYMEELNLEMVAEKYYFNPSYFSTLFKSCFHKTFSEYLIELRMTKAKELLLATNDKIREVAWKTGYRDANYFVRAFKRFYGVTPEEYRKISGKTMGGGWK